MRARTPSGHSPDDAFGATVGDASNYEFDDAPRAVLAWSELEQLLLSLLHAISPPLHVGPIGPSQAREADDRCPVGIVLPGEADAAEQVDGGLGHPLVGLSALNQAAHWSRSCFWGFLLLAGCWTVPEGDFSRAP